MTRKEIEQMAIEYDRNLKTHPMSAGELRKDLVEFAMQVVKNCSIPDVVNRRELLIAFFNTISTDDFEIEDTETIVDRFLGN